MNLVRQVTASNWEFKGFKLGKLSSVVTSPCAVIIGRLYAVKAIALAVAHLCLIKYYDLLQVSTLIVIFRQFQLSELKSLETCRVTLTF
jgi:hypothetical protein